MADGERSPLLPPEAGPGPGGAAASGERRGVAAGRTGGRGFIVGAWLGKAGKNRREGGVA